MDNSEASDTERNREGERETLYDGDDVTFRRYQSGRYGLTVGGLRVVFADVRTPPATSVHEFLDDRGEHIASIRRSDVPYKVTTALDEVENG